MAGGEHPRRYSGRMWDVSTDRLHGSWHGRRRRAVPRPRSRSLVAFVAGLLLLAVAAQTASAVTVRIKPSRVAKHAMLFKIKNINPEAIVRARLATHRGLTRLKVATVRRAAAKGKLRLTRSARWSRRAKLETLRRSRLLISYKANIPPLVSGAQQSWQCGWRTFRAASMPDACWRPFSDTSFVNTPLPPNPRLVPNSSAMVARMLSFGEMKPIWPNPEPSLDYQHPYFFSQSSDPLFTVDSSRPGSPDGLQVRIPSNARPAAAEDSHLAVFDQDGGYEYSFFGFPKSRPAGGGTISAQLVQRAKIDEGGAAEQITGFSTAAALGNMAGIVRQPELAAGRIDHALFLVTGDTNGQQVFPARSYGRACDESDCPPTGQWLMLDMSESEIAALPVADWQKTIYRALAKYGGWIGDQGGSTALLVQAEGPTTWRDENPWLAWAEAQRAKPNSHINTYTADGEKRYRLEVWDAPIDWKAKLKAVDPCVIQRTC